LTLTALNICGNRANSINNCSGIDNAIPLLGWEKFGVIIAYRGVGIVAPKEEYESFGIGSTAVIITVDRLNVNVL